MGRVLLAIVLTIGLATPVWADLQSGIDAYKRGDYATALKEWRPLAEAGNANAQYKLGIMYFKGQGVSKDFVEAAKWYRKAAKQGNPIAIGRLARLEREIARQMRKAEAGSFRISSLGLPSSLCQRMGRDLVNQFGQRASLPVSLELTRENGLRLVGVLATLRDQECAGFEPGHHAKRPAIAPT